MINIGSEYINYTTKTIDKYMRYILEKSYNKNIINKYTDAYIEYRYGNYVSNANKSSVTKNVLAELNKVTESLSDYKDQRYLENVEALYKYIFDLDSLYVLEKQSKAITEIARLRDKLLGIESETFVEDFAMMVREDIAKKKGFVDSLKSENFDIRFKKINDDKNFVKVELTNDIKFPNLYSKLAIDATAQKDTINEDLTVVKTALTAARILEDLISFSYDVIYCINLPKSIIDKKGKLNRLTTLIDNEFIADKIRLLINFDTFDRFRTYIFELMKKGFIFDIYLDDKFNYSSENIEYLITFEKIFMQKDKYYYKDMTKNGTIKGRIEIVDGVV